MGQQAIRFALLGVLMAVVAACAASDETSRTLALHSPAAARLSGSWSVRLAFDIGAGKSSPAVARKVAFGTITLAPDRLGHISTPRLPGATHGGVYELDMRGLGFAPDVHEPVPAAVARVAPGGERGALAPARFIPDSVFIVLSPSAERLAIHLAGELRGDTVIGRWRAESFSAGGGAGPFVMHRQRATP